MINKLLCVFILLLSFACQNHADSRSKVARVYNEYLYLDQLPVLENLTLEDSTLFINNFINQWAKEKLLIHKAILNVNQPIYILIVF